jgi:hypothetical protein
VTQDVDIVLPASEIDDFLQTAAVAGFQVLTVPEGRWPKVQHKATDITVDILPEGARPGTPTRLAPTLIPHPKTMGAVRAQLTYIRLPALVELKIAAGRTKDNLDIIELLRANPHSLAELRDHLATIHSDYVEKFDSLALLAAEDDSH